MQVCDGCDNHRDNGEGRVGAASWDGSWGRLKGILWLAEEMLREHVLREVGRWQKEAEEVNPG